MRKFAALFLAIFMVFAVLPMYGCSNDKSGEIIELNVYNCEDYIAQGNEVDLVKNFEKHYKEKYGKTVKVNYSTFGTNENMYNELQLSKVKTDNGYDYGYDLVCTSDYMIQKMIYEGMVEKLDYSIPVGQEGNLNDYLSNVSSHIYTLFSNQEDIDGNKINWNEYTVAYMFGTMGFIYNPEILSKNADYVIGDESHWDFPWKTYTKNLGTIKDSIRDTYALAIGKVYKNELTLLGNQYKNEEITLSEYQKKLIEIFNRVDSETIDKVTDELIELKSNVYGFEVDSGKRDMASGKIAINFAWSGDAVYTLDIAEADGTILYYTVPEEGSNIWFDGWLMPKGANVKVAQEFINFLSKPENAIANMDFIGYTPAIAGKEMYDNCVDWYGTYVLIETSDVTAETVTINGKNYNEVYFGDLSDEELSSMRNSDETYNIIYPEYDDEDNVIGLYQKNNVEMYEYDVSIILNNLSDAASGNVYTVWTEAENVNRQLFTQYPNADTVNRCAIMKHLSNDDMKLLNDMWDEVKVSAIPVWLMWLIVGIIVLIIVFVPLFTYLNKKGVRVNIKIKNKNLVPVSRTMIK